MGDDFKVAYIIGAGFSVPAGLLDITQITESFLIDIKNGELLPNKKLIKNVIELWEVTNSHFIDRRDLESFLTLLRMLEDPEEFKLLTTSYKKLLKISAENIETIKTVTQRYIRTKLENIKDIKYLDNIRGFHYPLNIFTLNYDSLIDVFCETYNIRYTDGFDPYWNSELFSEEGYKVKLYRLHGSLYWLKTSSGKTLKIPVKGLDISKQRYISDEILSEMIIYPTFQKDKYSEIYSWIANQFIKIIKESNLCIIIGYNLRDKDIRDNIIDLIRNNKNLFILIISPNATSRSNYFIQLSEEEISRIGYIDEEIQNMFMEAKLFYKIESLKGYMQSETDTIKTTFTASIQALKNNTSYNTNMENMIRSYISNGFKGRADYLFKKYKIQ